MADDKQHDFLPSTHHDAAPDEPHAGDRRPSESWSDLKAAQIRRACKDNDLDALSELATSKGGLLTDRLRCDACTPARHLWNHALTDLQG